MPTHFQLTDAVINTTNPLNDVETLDRWITDEDWVRSFRNKSGFGKVTPEELNRAISKTIDFVNDKFVDPTSGRTIFNNSRKILTNAKEKTKKNIFSTMSYLRIETKGRNYRTKQSSGKPFGTTWNVAAGG
jgi:hypothetical protein